MKTLSPLIGLPADLPDGVQEQVDLFLSDYPRTGPELARRYIQLVLSDAYRSRVMGRSNNQLYQANRTENESKKASKSTSKASRTRKAN